MISTSDFKIGLSIEIESQLFQIVDFQHVKPGKGGAFVRTKLKNVENQRVVEKTFNAGVKVKSARLELNAHQYVYKDAFGYHFMDMKSFEEVVLDESLVSAHSLLKEGQEVFILYHSEANRYISCELPPFVELKVVSTDPGVKGDTVNKALKVAVLETGAEVKVPLFIEVDEILKIDTRTMQYAERSKSK